MIEVTIPGHDNIYLRHAVLDYSGTLAFDGRLIEGVSERLNALDGHLAIHVITADTFGRAAEELTGLPCELRIVTGNHLDIAKMDFIANLGSQNCVCVGNGRSDRLMLRNAALGIAVLGPEGAASDTVAAAHILAPSILAALDLILNPPRLVATLRV